jgi:predicted nucleotidyltransferase
VIKEIEKQIVDFLIKKIPELQGIYIFGSYVNKTITSKSDVDIAFLSFKKISVVEKWKIQEELASILNVNVYLVDLKDASLVLRSEIIENGERIYTADAFECDNFEVTTYSLYSDLNESRMHIINDLKAKYGRNSN